LSKVTFSNDPWDLHRRGERDRARHNEKLREAIKKNLDKIIRREDIITSDGKGIVKVPIKGLALPRFRYSYQKQKFVGQGEGGSKPYQIIGQDSDGKGKGKLAGNAPGEDVYDAEFTVAELIEMALEDLELPNLKDKSSNKLKQVSDEFSSISRSGIMSQLDKKRTLLEAIKRCRSEGKEEIEIEDSDFRFKTWIEKEELKNNAVIFAMRDVSGSMGDEEAYLSRILYYWMYQFLKSKYDRSEIVFITCHTEAKEVDESEFFRAMGTGGTMMSRAYALAGKIIKSRYDPNDWNIYIFLISDGHNFDDEDTVKEIQKILPLCNLSGYAEIQDSLWMRPKDSEFNPLGRKLNEELAGDPRFVSAKIQAKEDVWKALKKFFGKSIEE